MLLILKRLSSTLVKKTVQTFLSLFNRFFGLMIVQFHVRLKKQHLAGLVDLSLFETIVGCKTVVTFLPHTLNTFTGKLSRLHCGPCRKRNIGN